MLLIRRLRVAQICNLQPYGSCSAPGRGRSSLLRIPSTTWFASTGFFLALVQNSNDQLSDETASEVGSDFGALVLERQRMDRRDSARPRSE